MSERKLNRRSFLIAASLLPVIFSSGSSPASHEQAVWREWKRLRSVAEPPTRDEIIAFAVEQKTLHANGFGYTEEPLEASQIPALGESLQYGSRFVIQANDQLPFQSFLFTNSPAEEVEQVALYCHSIAGPAYDLNHWRSGFESMFDRKTALLMPVTRAFETPTNKTSYDNPGFITDSRPVDVLRSIAVVSDRYPLWKDLPWDIIGMSMGSGMPYAMAAVWKDFNGYYPLPGNVRSIGLFAPYDSLFYESELLEALLTDPKGLEVGGIDLALKWTIADTAYLAGYRRGLKDINKPVIHDLMSFDESTVVMLRRNMMKSSPGMYHEAAQAADWPVLDAPVTVYRAALDRIIPPEQTDAAVQRMQGAGSTVQEIYSGIPSGHIADVFHHDILNNVVNGMRR